MKILDKMMLKSFASPYLATFFIALFVLVMQTLWVYIDAIAGKGVGMLVLTELVGYMSVSMFPLALPIAVLISSVMVLGNMAERYELSSFKSAGVSLWRVMQPLFFASLAIAAFSVFCANNLIPVSNLKFKSRLYDISEQKPALNLEAGIFNDDFKGYSLFIGKKAADNRQIENIVVIDHTKASSGQILELLARKGEMFVTKDKKHFVLRLYDGWQYQEPKSVSKTEKHPFMRVSFKRWEKVFDLSEFELSRTDENLFHSETMLNSRQLLEAIDSIDLLSQQRIERFAEAVAEQFTPLRKELKKKRKKTSEKAVEKPDNPDSLERHINIFTPTGKKPLRKPQRQRKNAPKQTNIQQLSSLNSILETFPKASRKDLLQRAKVVARSTHHQADSAVRSLKLKREQRAKYVFELNSKYSLAFACILFLFIGAPMGAIVRKGGFGYPMLIAIGFFMLFMIITIFSKNIVEKDIIHPVIAAWLPNIILFPISLLLTYQAMNGYKNIISTSLLRLWYNLRRIKLEDP